MLQLKIFTLGGLSIQLGDQPVRGFVSRKVEALLVYLAYERREHPRELLATLLWEDLSQTRAMANLRMALSNVQSLLPHYLIATRQSLMINPDSPCWLDAIELSQALKLANSKLTGSVTHQLENALQLYKGEFLGGFHLRDSPAFEGWMMLEADRLRGRVIETLKTLSRASLDRGDFANGIEKAKQVLDIDPLAEETHRTLMLLLARSGQRTAALAQYETCVRLLQEELDIAPEAETTRLYTQIQTEHTTSIHKTDKILIRLPIPATPFIERPTELQQISERLDNPDCRLLTIVGPGGIGKTRLALQAAAEHAHEYRDGVYFIPLVSVQSGSFLPVEIASVLHLSLQGIVQPIEELIGYLADREILLVLDNFEHLVESASLLSNILSQSPGVRILATSREWLNVQQEWVLPIGGMDYPATASTDAASYNAVQLFVACAKRIRPRFSLEEDLAAVVAICQLVEGMPLSIELAAAWLRVIPASEIVQEIGVKFLATTARDVPERHRSVDAVFDYSWQQLSVDEAGVLMKLSVFKGPFSRAAAIQVAGATVRILASLIEKSLIRLVDEAHYDIHELLRQYAFNQLTESGEATTTQDAHLNYYAGLLSNPDAQLHGPQQTVWLDRLEQEHDNLRTALSRALSRETPAQGEAGLTLGASIWEFWLMRGHISEGRQWMEQLLSATIGATSLARGAVMQGAGYLAWVQGEYDQAASLHQESLVIRREVGDKTGIGDSLNGLGMIAWSRGDYRTAHDYYEQALAAQREADYKLGMASVLVNLSRLLQDQGEYTDAIAHNEEAWTIFNELDDLHGMTQVLNNLGALTYDQGDLHRAKEIEEKALESAHQLGDQRVIGAVLQNLGQTLIALGEYAGAHTCLDESLPLVMQAGDKVHTGLVKKTMALLALREGNLQNAEMLLNESLKIFRSLKAEVLLAQSLLVQGDIHQYGASAN
jgi:predicted ATPase/DNA-binding SARP family transcriptional activator